MNTDIFCTLSSLLHVDLVYENHDGSLISYSDTGDLNILRQSLPLRSRLTENAASLDFPFLMQDSFHCFFAAFSLDNGTLLIGPMCHEHLDRLHRRQMYRYYGIHTDGLAEAMDRDSGRLSSSDHQHRKNMAVVGITPSYLSRLFQKEVCSFSKPELLWKYLQKI